MRVQRFIIIFIINCHCKVFVDTIMACRVMKYELNFASQVLYAFSRREKNKYLRSVFLNGFITCIITIFFMRLIFINIINKNKCFMVNKTVIWSFMKNCSFRHKKNGTTDSRRNINWSETCRSCQTGTHTHIWLFNSHYTSI